MDGYDPQFFFLMNKQSQIKGLLAFNQESNIVRKPEIDNDSCKVSVTRDTKVQLHHISSLDESVLEEFID